jgi:hypothetical protein
LLQPNLEDHIDVADEDFLKYFPFLGRLCFEFIIRHYNKTIPSILEMDSQLQADDQNDFKKTNSLILESMQNNPCLQKFHPWRTIQPTKGLKLYNHVAETVEFDEFLEN